MKEKIKIGIIICDRYHDCTGGKCFRAIKEKTGAYSIYNGKDIEVVGYTTCGGCPGGNIEYCPEELKKNGAVVIHFATGMIVGYPPCPYINHFKSFIEAKYKLKVVIGTHPIPQKYYLTHTEIKSWDSDEWRELIKNTLDNENVRISYD